MNRVRSRGKLLVLSGPSGSGKSTVIDRLLADSSLNLEVSPSLTTRPPRLDDQHVKKYHYVTEAEFERIRQEGKLLECASVSGHWYGTPKEPVEQALSQGRWRLLEIDVQGGLAIKKLFSDCVMIFLKAPSLDEYKKRLKRRGTNSAEEIEQRLETARWELELASNYDYHVVNENLDQTVSEIRELIEVCGGTIGA